MLKHRGFPGRLPGTDFQYTIRRPNPKGVTPITARERFRDRKPADRRADAGFVTALVQHFWDQPFERGWITSSTNPRSAATNGFANRSS